MDSILDTLDVDSLKSVLKRVLSSSEEAMICVKAAIEEVCNAKDVCEGKKQKFQKVKKEDKVFDMSRYYQRHVAMQIQ